MADQGQGDVVAPSREDPVAAALSGSVGGASGEHARGHRWWTPLRVVLAVTAVVFALGMLQKVPCYQDTWNNGETRYSKMCYSDMPYLYTGRGFVEKLWPYTDDAETNARFRVMEYPVGISYFAWGVSWVTHWVAGSPDIEDRPGTPLDQLRGEAQVQKEIRTYVAVSAVFLGIFTLIAAWFLVGVNPRRPWDALLFAAAPVLLFNALINWDLLAVTFVAGALWAWARDRPILTGVMIGLGTAAKLYPLFLLGGILVICIRRRQWMPMAWATFAAITAWLLANAPAYLTGPEAWKVFWSFNSDRGADLGSLWLALDRGGLELSNGFINNFSWAFFIAWCLGVLALGLIAPKTPRFTQLGFLIVAGFLLVNKVYSPQYVLWLLPLAVLAVPRWRDQIIWQAGELFYFASVWWYLGGHLRATDGGTPVYWAAIVLRMAVELYLVVIVVRDILRPEEDLVEREEPVPWRRTEPAEVGGKPAPGA
ncbi:glycosyltransferase 87 family protein [Nocardioides sp. AE5]|uniref:glycosyltransferase family 87 protein n=1 Tax=Nocardioides sp. AE5 TaxID=2962573 RepID=UPI002882B134|nr:glycosyltransferase 87 family protein [Nocardioides sp. AE5]MDT0202443.1 glycosyltransferase 87 family protein [Nocardioides sp. AE5]